MRELKAINVSIGREIGAVVLLIVLGLGGCAGVQENTVTHSDGELCLRMDSGLEGAIEMHVCNCGSKPARVLQGLLPWDPVQWDAFGLDILDGGVLTSATKKDNTSFVHIEPGLYFLIPTNECLHGSVDLRDAFLLDGIPRVDWISVEWTGFAYGLREQWPLDAKIVLSTQ